MCCKHFSKREFSGFFSLFVGRGGGKNFGFLIREFPVALTLTVTLNRVVPAVLLTRSSATAKSTARPSCLVGVLYYIYRETNTHIFIHRKSVAHEIT